MYSNGSDSHPALGRLARSLVQHRIGLGLTQAQLARQAGVAKRTIERLESNGTAQLGTLVRVLEVLGLLDRFQQLFPEASPTPMAVLALRGKERKRVRAPRRQMPPSAWTWGPDS